jgi:mono/diheme cytochrome c family protein
LSSAQGTGDADNQPPRKPTLVLPPPTAAEKSTSGGEADPDVNATATEDDDTAAGDESTAVATSTAGDGTDTDTATATGGSDTATSTGTDVDADSELIDRAEVEADDTLTYNDFAKDFLDTWCVACHGAQNGSAPGIRLDVYADAGGMQGVYTTREALADRIALNTMPPGGSKPTLEDRLALLAWVEAGAPEADPIVTPAPAFDADVTEPNAVEEAPSTDSFTVQLSFANAAAGAVWSLYYTQTPGDQTNGTAIVTGQPVTTTSYAWDTSNVANATYYLYVVATSGGVTVKASSVGSVKVANASNNAPTIALAGTFAAATTAGFVDASSGTVQITYTVSDADGDTVSLKIERSSNGGATYGTLIVDGHTQTSSYTWSTPTSGDLVNERIRITAADGKGGASTVESPVYVMSTNAYTYDGSIGSLLTAQCGCHPNGQPAGTPYDPGSYASVFSNRNLIKTKSVDGGMGGLSPAEKDKLLVWIKRGAPQ